MKLDEILEENSVKTISQKTKISGANLEAIFAGKFEDISKNKALGFLAIIEREYNAELNTLREEALAYYDTHKEDNSYSAGQYYLDDETKGKSKLFVFVVVGLLIYASWYFFTQFDKKNLNGLTHFVDENIIENLVNTKEDVNITDATADLSIANVTLKEVEVVESVEVIEKIMAEEIKEVASTPVIVKEKVEDVPSYDVSALVNSLVDASVQEEVVDTVPQKISIVPVNRLWFGLVNIKSKERKHFSIDTGYPLDVSEQGWLLATSSAPFSLVQSGKTENFNDAKEHYFKVDNNGIIALSKSQYVEQGGWHQW